MEVSLIMIISSRGPNIPDSLSLSIRFYRS